MLVGRARTLRDDSGCMSAERFRAYRAPRADGQVLIDPPLEQPQEVLRAAEERVAAWDIELCGQSIHAWRREGRRSVVAAAYRYTSTYRDVTMGAGPPQPDRPLLMAGHQPELFHPGVWFKNFELSRLARRLGSDGQLGSDGKGCCAVNLIVDNDLCRSPGIRVPTLGPDGAIQATVVNFDQPQTAVAWEQRPIQSPELLQGFSKRIAQVWPETWHRPIVHDLWPHVVAACQRTNLLGLALAQGRHAYEATLGLETLELPLSELAQTEVFAAFVIGMLGNLPRLHEVYNTAVGEYRAAHHLRSRSHPVPDLATVDTWLEAPFWIYSDASPQRRHLFVRWIDGGFELTDRAGQSVRIDGDLERPDAAGQLLERLNAAGLKLRPRALMTTAFSRLLLGDLFLHGIGGGKYDQLTDLIIERYFGVTAPKYAVISATYLLPEALDIVRLDAQTHELRDQMRRLRFQPERFAEVRRSSASGLKRSDACWLSSHPVATVGYGMKSLSN